MSIQNWARCARISAFDSPLQLELPSLQKLWFADTVLWLPLIINEAFKWFSPLPVLMQISFWRWQCSLRYSPPPPPHPTPSGTRVPASTSLETTWRWTSLTQKKTTQISAMVSITESSIASSFEGWGGGGGGCWLGTSIFFSAFFLSQYDLGGKFRLPYLGSGTSIFFFSCPAWPS